MEILSIGELFIHTDQGEVKREAFETWLIQNSKLDWCLDTANYKGEHDQRLGTFTLEQYYETPYIKTDLEDYIKIIKSENKLKSFPDYGKYNLLNLSKHEKSKTDK
jgi:hypothetical protein